MSFRVRSSKFRHVFGSANKKDSCYESIKISKNAHDSNFCEVNPKFLSVVTESAGGGSFLVLPLEKVGRIDANSPKVSGHTGPILDIKWNPFSDHVIASASDDATVKLWQIPEQGLTETLSDWLVDLHGHTRRVGYLDWHPTAENVLLSAGYDFNCILWNVETAEPVNILSLHPDNIFSISWNYDGSLFATTCKDKNLRVIDPRQGNIVSECASHQGTKASKVKFLGNKGKLFTVGFSRMSERQYGIWDVRNMTKALHMNTIDNSSGIMFPFYDSDNNVMFLAGKGDGNIRYFEIVDDAPFIHYLNQYQSGSPQRGLGVMPKRGLDTSRCEIMRFYKLHSVKALVEPISMIVPRKSEMFQEDIYPPTCSTLPSLSADEWIAGSNRDPILMSVKDGQILASTRSSTAKAVQRKKGVRPSYSEGPAHPHPSNRNGNSTPRKITVLRRSQISDRSHCNRSSLCSNGSERLNNSVTVKNCIHSNNATLKLESSSGKTRSAGCIKVLLTSKPHPTKCTAREARSSGPVTTSCTQRNSKMATKATLSRVPAQTSHMSRVKDGGIVPNPTITTYKAMKRGQSVTEAPSVKRSSPMSKTASVDRPTVPASVKNIAKLSNTTDKGEQTDVFNKIGMFERKTKQNSPERQWSPTQSTGQQREGSPEKQWTAGYQSTVKTEVMGSPSAAEESTPLCARLVDPPSHQNSARGDTLHTPQEVAIAQHSPVFDRPQAKKSPQQVPTNQLFPDMRLTKDPNDQVFSDDSDTLSPDNGLVPSPSQHAGAKKRGRRTHSYRRRREKRILNESSDQDTFSTPPTSPGMKTWNENPVFGPDASVDISALDDALHDFEELSKSFHPSTQPQMGSRTNAAPNQAKQQTANVQKKQTTSNALSKSEKHLDQEHSAPPKDEIVASKSMTNIGAGLELQHPTSESPQISGKLSQSAHTIHSFGANELTSPENSESTEMIDFINTDAPDNTLIKPSKLRASMKSKRRLTQEIGERRRSSFDHSPSPGPRHSSHSPSPGPKAKSQSQLDQVTSPERNSPKKASFHEQSSLKAKPQTQQVTSPEWNCPQGSLQEKASNQEQSTLKFKSQEEREVSPEWSNLHRVGSLREKPTSREQDSSLRRAQSLRDRNRRPMTIVEMNSKPAKELNNNSYDMSGKISPRTVSRPLQLALDMDSTSKQTSKARPAQRSNSIDSGTNAGKQAAERQDSFTSSTRVQLNSPIINQLQSPVQMQPGKNTRGHMHSPGGSSVQAHPHSVQVPSPTHHLPQSVQTRNLQFTSGQSQDRVSPEKFVFSPTDGNRVIPSSYSTGPVPDQLKNGAADIDNLVLSPQPAWSKSPITRKIHVKKVWSPRSPSQSEPVLENGDTLPSTDPESIIVKTQLENKAALLTENSREDAELRKAYFRQLEEIESLKQQITYKDKRIRQLEEELQMLRLPDSPELGESTC